MAKECSTCHGTGKCQACRGTAHVGYPGFGPVDKYPDHCYACQSSGDCCILPRLRTKVEVFNVGAPGMAACWWRRGRPMQKGQKRVGAQPCVGIFWVFGGEVILDTTPISQADRYGEAMTHPRGHLQHWTELQRTGSGFAGLGV